MTSDGDRSRFLTAVSHDMRQPLHALLLYLGALERRVGDEEARGILAKADRAAQSLAGMFESLITLARLDAGKLEPDVAQISLNELFASIASRTPGIAARPTEVSVRSDPLLLETILRALAANAVRHGGGGELGASERGDSIEIAVSDNGAGIAAADHDRIFDEFVRLEGASPEGLGLGLTLARKLATLLGHRIEVRSSPGAGAAFVVTAPRA